MHLSAHHFIGLLSLVFLFLFARPVQAQPSPKDLHTQLAHTTNKQERRDLLERIWEVELEQDVTKAIEIANEWLGIATEFRDTLDMIAAHNALVDALTAQGSYESGLGHGIEAWHLAEAINDSTTLHRTFTGIGLLHIRTALYEEAHDYHLRALEVARHIPCDTVLLYGTSYQHLAKVHKIKWDSATEEFYHRKALALFRNPAYEHKHFDVLMAMVSTYVGRVQLDSAQRYLEEARGLSITHTSPRRRSLYLDLLGMYYLERQEYQTAIDTFKAGMPLTNSVGNRWLRIFYHGHMAETYKQLVQWDSAMQHLERHYGLWQFVHYEESRQRLAEMEAKFQNQQQALEISELHTEQAEHQATIARQRSQLLGLGSGAAIALLLGWFLYQRYRLRQKANVQQLLAEQQKEGTRSIVLAQEEERKRIARDLHDGIGQMIATLKLTWEMQRDNKLSNGRERLTELFTTCSTEVRNLAHQMMPLTLESKGLVAATDELLNKSLAIQNIHYEFDHMNLPERLEPELEICLYRVLQELISNMLKHASPSQVSVQLYKASNNVVMNVVDDSSTFNATEKTGLGQGLMNMMTRIKSMNGQLLFEPASTRGMSALVKLPMA